MYTSCLQLRQCTWAMQKQALAEQAALSREIAELARLAAAAGVLGETPPGAEHPAHTEDPPHEQQAEATFEREESQPSTAFGDVPRVETVRTLIPTLSSAELQALREAEEALQSVTAQQGRQTAGAPRDVFVSLKEEERALEALVEAANAVVSAAKQSELVSRTLV
eukprot:Sspe_Gene.113493::Locus_97850_Transcript_1_1_Confidence_1.000_Length_621::g.113493::m.113493